MWSHQLAGRSQVGWLQMRSRTWMARRVAPVKKRSVGGHSTRAMGRVTACSKLRQSTVFIVAVAPIVTRGYSARSMSACSSQGMRWPGGTTVPPASWQRRP